MNLKINVIHAEVSLSLIALKDAADEIGQMIFDNDTLSNIVDYGIRSAVEDSETFENMPEGIREILKPLIIEKVKALTAEALNSWMAEQ